MRRVVTIVLGTVLLLSAIGTGTYFLFKPKELLGSESMHDMVALQIGDSLFYGMCVPVEAKLESTDGTTICLYDLLTVGVQSMEPATLCKVKVRNWQVFAPSKNGWLKAIQAGFEQEVPYGGSYDTEDAKQIDTVSDVVMKLDEGLLEDLREGISYAFGGQEFATSQIAYGIFEIATERALLKMLTLYKQPILYSMMVDNKLWVLESLYIMAVAPISYNICLAVTSYGGMGRQYVAKLMGDAA